MTYEEMQAWFESDFLSVDLLEPVEFQKLNKSGDPILVVPIEFALRRAMSNKMLIEERLISSSEFLMSAAKTTIWHILVSALPEIEPTKGNILIDRFNVRWVIWQVETQTAMTRYKLTCIRE